MSTQFKFVLTPAEAEFKGIKNSQDLPKLCEEAMQLSRAPISGQQFGLVGLGSSGRVFFGVKVEFEGLTPEDSIDAEQFLITNLALNSELSLIGCFFPNNTDSQSLEEHAMNLLKPHNNRLAFSNPKDAAEICSNPEHCSHINCRALTAANKSYAPFRKCPSGVALICKGQVYRGWYLEEDAYSSYIGPVQAALVDFVARSQGERYDKIVEAVLVEKDNAVVSHADTTRILLEIIAPHCNFNVVPCCEMPEEN